MHFQAIDSLEREKKQAYRRSNRLQNCDKTENSTTDTKCTLQQFP